MGELDGMLRQPASGGHRKLSVERSPTFASWGDGNSKSHCDPRRWQVRSISEVGGVHSIFSTDYGSEQYVKCKKKCKIIYYLRVLARGCRTVAGP